jgi:hypothetical protein
VYYCCVLSECCRECFLLRCLFHSSENSDNVWETLWRLFSHFPRTFDLSCLNSYMDRLTQINSWSVPGTAGRRLGLNMLWLGRSKDSVNVQSIGECEGEIKLMFWKEQKMQQSGMSVYVLWYCTAVYVQKLIKLLLPVQDNRHCSRPDQYLQPQNWIVCKCSALVQIY